MFRADSGPSIAKNEDMKLYDSLRSRPLRRTPDALAGGVCAGLAHRWGISAVLVRLAFVALAIVGGIGFLLYGLGWLLIPSYATEEIVAEGALRNPDSAFAASIILILVGAVVFVPFVAVWADFALNRAPGLALMGVLVILVSVLFVLWRNGRRSTPRGVYDAAQFGSAPYGPGSEFPAPAHPVRPLKEPKPKKPALGGQAISVVVAIAFIGSAIALLAVPGKVAAILMALSVGLGIVAIGVMYAGVRGLRATWLTALAWFLALPASAALAIALIMPTSMVTAPNLELVSFGSSERPSLLSVSHSGVNSDPGQLRDYNVDAFILADAPYLFRESDPIIIEVTRNEDVYGVADVALNGWEPWRVDVAGETWTEPVYDTGDNPDERWWSNIHLGAGESVRIYSPAAITNPDAVTTATINFSYGSLYLSSLPKGN